MSQTPSPPQTVYLADYRPPDWLIDEVELVFQLAEDSVEVQARLSCRRNPVGDPQAALWLDGEGLQLLAVAVDGRPLASAEYALDARGLKLTGLPGQCVLHTRVALRPQDNTELSGLYRSGGIFCTQCEAQGFRRITFFPDRPDVMARYRVRIEADRAGYPVLLSNGNPLERGETSDGRHWVVWEDPFPKPSYLFALVAGDLAEVQDRFITCSGRPVSLHIFVEAHNRDRCDHAMRSLQRAMRWDEENYGREYDLDRFMIVAVDDFNMGAMENKGLNIFNSKFILATPETATDTDYQNIEGVVAHEYFHNWSGNRVTCRDWFQLSLKEGFTVFRDQSFSADMAAAGGARAVRRIHDVALLRTHQFPEDAGPLAHPVRPESYIAIDNFYTATVYEKGAELIRMLAILLGPEDYRRGCDLYFERHDGQAVTTDDFVQALADASGRDLTRFKRWYSQAGTPVLTVEEHWDAQIGRYRLLLRQHTPPTPGQQDKQPFVIPVALGLINRDTGAPLPLRLVGEPATTAPTESRVLVLEETKQEFEFEGLAGLQSPPLASLLRGFSAPVRLQREIGLDDLAALMRLDGDDFNRWEAAQALAVRLIQGLVAEPASSIPGFYLEAVGQALAQAEKAPGLAAELLGLPTETYLGESFDPLDPPAIHAARERLAQGIAQTHGAALQALYLRLDPPGDLADDDAAPGRRALRNRCLDYLARIPPGRELAAAQYQTSRGMTDRLAAMVAAVHHDHPGAMDILADFEARWTADPLLLDKWFAVQASAPGQGTRERVRVLLEHPGFSLKTPNRVYSLVRTFAANPAQFHAADGGGYRLLGELLGRLDALNPQVAARLSKAFNQWRRLDPARQVMVRAEMETLLAGQTSSDLYEVISKYLG